MKIVTRELPDGREQRLYEDAGWECPRDMHLWKGRQFGGFDDQGRQWGIDDCVICGSRRAAMFPVRK